MKTKFMLMLLCALALLSSPVFAGENIRAQKVINVGTGWAGEGFFVGVADTTLANRCGLSRFVIRADHPMLKIMVAELLLALQTGNKVDLYFDGCKASDMNLAGVFVYKE